MTDQMPSVPTTPPPPGWYSDPQAPKLTRYWDGLQWTPMIRTPSQRRWRTVGTALKWVLIAFVAMFVLAVIVAQF